MSDHNTSQKTDRRGFFKRCVIGGCSMAWAAYTGVELGLEGGESGMRVGFRNDAPQTLWRWSKKALWYSRASVGGEEQIHCELCPHQCVLAENDRGFCRTRVVKNNTLFSVAYGNPCAVHIDPVEKKPLHHFLPGTPIVSVATAGCNLRCRNCQNWQISQSKPEDTDNQDLFPEDLVSETLKRNIPSIAYTYSEPIIYYEYVMDSAAEARKHNIKNVLVTAGYILPAPLRSLCRFIDAANVDLKSFNDSFYRNVSGATLAPVLRGLEIMREEGVWLEITRLIVPTLSENIDDIYRGAKWIVKNLGAYTPLHLSRFHPAYKLLRLPPTPTKVLLDAQKAAHDAGLQYVYVGNVMTPDGLNTVCPHCGKALIIRRGYRIIENHLKNGHCPCGEKIPGVWSN